MDSISFYDGIMMGKFHMPQYILTESNWAGLFRISGG